MTAETEYRLRAWNLLCRQVREMRREFDPEVMMLPNDSQARAAYGMQQTPGSAFRVWFMTEDGLRQYVERCAEYVDRVGCTWRATPNTLLLYRDWSREQAKCALLSEGLGIHPHYAVFEDRTGSLWREGNPSSTDDGGR